MTLSRPLYCPICGARVLVEVDHDGEYPEVDRIPDHSPASDVNLCQGVVVTVTLDFDRCRQCGGKMGKHPTGLCRRCFGEQSP